MTAPRLTLLYSKFFRGPVASELGPIRTSVRQRPQRNRAVRYSTSAARREEVRPHRYGTANEPPPHILAARGQSTTDAKASKPATASEGQASIAETTVTQGNPNLRQAEREQPPAAEEPDEGEPMQPHQEVVSGGSNATELPLPAAPSSPNLGTLPEKPLETVLQMPPPSEASDENKPPHLAPPRYVHHFDTWGLVQDLKKGGFAEDASVTLMKAVRGILSENMELARRGLVSKSNVENETYLFRAACSELKTEIQNNRKTEMEKLRAQRAQLQHEVDILNQKFSQETASVKDDLKGMFDDRKMTVKMEQRNFENKIQELNYKIQVVMNSDARTEVEAIRWVLTRRAAGALGVAVLMILSALNYSRYMTQTQEKERKQHEALMQKQAAIDSVGKAVTQSGADEEALLAGEGVTTA